MESFVHNTKKLLYITVKQTPYRTLFFNHLATLCDLKVLYEYGDPGTRNKQWAQSEQVSHRYVCLHEETSSTFMSFIRMMRWVYREKWDGIIIGCWNLRVELLAMLVMRLLGKSFTLNLDGEYFLNGSSIRQRLKRLLVKCANSYVIAGEQSAKGLRKIVGNKPVVVYNFSSLTNEEIHQKSMRETKRGESVLVVGRDYYVKGMDLIVPIARMNPAIHYKVIGMGEAGIASFKQANDLSGIQNIEFVPFLQKTDLDKEYQTCKMLLLPSRQECWGLVVNEAAAFGTPIVSTYGSGAAVEFLQEAYPQYLAEPDHARALYRCIERLFADEKVGAYSQFLKEKSKQYSIEYSAQAHIEIL